MADPSYRIYYGKYPDLLTGQIPTEHIRSCDGLTFRIEPGKPAEPKVDKVSFTLDNLDHTGAERYGRAWFEANARSQAEGAVVPEQLFFRIELFGPGAKGFTGIVGKKSYAPWRETVTITLKDPRELIAKGDVYMLKAFTFEGCTLQEKRQGPAPEYGLPAGKDLEGHSLTDERLTFFYLGPRVSSYSQLHLDHPYWEHRNLAPVIANTDASDVGRIIWSDTRSVWIKIGENTILTRITEYLVPLFTGWGDIEFTLSLGMSVFHCHNGNYEHNNKVVLERGRFFADAEGTDLQTGQEYAITIYDYNHGYSDDILLDKPLYFDGQDTFSFFNGYLIFENSNVPPTIYVIDSSSREFFDTLEVYTNAVEEKLYGKFYANPAGVDLFDLDRTPALNMYRLAFWADLMLYGWLGKRPAEILVNLAMQTGCYLYYNEQGKIVFHDRLYHASALPAQLPDGAFEVELEDIRPIGPHEEDYGFDSYQIEYADRIEINNVESEQRRTRHIGRDGVRSVPALRSTSLTIENYRTSDLGVPAKNDPVPQRVLRYSPSDPRRTDVALLPLFLPTPEIQAQRFAASWSYPEELWNIEWDLPRYPQAGIGGYFWVDWGDEKRVYLIRKITHDPDRMSCRIEAQKVGVWNG